MLLKIVVTFHLSGKHCIVPKGCNELDPYNSWVSILPGNRGDRKGLPYMSLDKTYYTALY